MYELQRTRYQLFWSNLVINIKFTWMNDQIVFQKIAWSYPSSIIIQWLKNKGKCFLQAKTFFNSKFNNFSCTMSWWLGFCLRQMLSGDIWISFVSWIARILVFCWYCHLERSKCGLQGIMYNVPSTKTLQRTAKHGLGGLW